MSHCPSCGANAAKPRVGTLGEQTGGMWCAQCGHVWDPVVIHYPPSAVKSVQWPVVDAACDIRTLTGDALDQYVCKVYGLIRDVLPSGRLETDDEFRARAIASRRPTWVKPGLVPVVPVQFAPKLITGTFARQYISNATTSQLDGAGTSIGHPRQPGETDDAYRGRLLS